MGEPSLAERIIALVVPVGMTALFVFLGLYFAPTKTEWLLGHATFSFFLAGKFIVLSGAVPGNLFTPWELGILITYMDTLTGILFVYNVDLFFRIPVVGERLRMIRIRARRMLHANPWLRRQSYIGIILFVMFPFTGTGAVGASFLGKFMGLNRFAHLGAICLGGALGGFSMASLTALLGRERAAQLLKQPVLLGILAIILFLLLFFLGRAFIKSAPRARSV